MDSDWVIDHLNGVQRVVSCLDELAEANGAPGRVDIAVGYCYLSGFSQVAGAAGGPWRMPREKREQLGSSRPKNV